MFPCQVCPLLDAVCARSAVGLIDGRTPSIYTHCYIHNVPWNLMASCNSLPFQCWSNSNRNCKVPLTCPLPPHVPHVVSPPLPPHTNVQSLVAMKKTSNALLTSQQTNLSGYVYVVFGNIKSRARYRYTASNLPFCCSNMHPAPPPLP